MTAFISIPKDSITFLDVGQGDAILIQNGTNQILIDGGPSADLLPRLAEQLPWFDRTIEVLILTHPQSDHLTGLLHILDKYQINLILIPQVPTSSQLQAAWLEAIIARQIPYRFAWAGEHLQVGDISARILNPLAIPRADAAIKADINNASVVTRIDFHDLSLLLTGDLESRAEKILVEQTQPKYLDIDILKIGHHGSKTSTSPTILKATSPKAAIITVGIDNKFGHPHESVISRLAHLPIFRTDLQGSIKFEYLNNAWRITCSRSPSCANSENELLKQ